MLIRVKHVHAVRAANGKTYYYHRPTRLKIRAEPGTIEFLREVEALNARVAIQQPVGGTLGALVAAYVASPEFADLSPATRASYRRVFDWLEPIRDMPLTQIDAPFVRALRDKAMKGSGRWLANYVVAVTGLTFAWGIPHRFAEANPAASVPRLKRPRGAPVANRAWTTAELEAVLDAAHPGIRRAVALGAYAGLREADALALRWSSLSGGALRLVQSKTGDRVVLPLHARLSALLTPSGAKDEHVVTGQRGRALTGAGFRAIFFGLLRKLKAEGRVGEGLTFHGLRHTVAVALAEAGASTRDIMAVTGHRTEAMVATYVEGAETERRARSAIRRLEKQKRGRV